MRTQGNLKCCVSLINSTHGRKLRPDTEICYVASMKLDKTTN